MQALWRNFWYGMSPADFLRAELRWTTERRILTVRLFIILMVVSLISVTLRLPPVVAISFAFVMMLGPSMTDYTMTVRTAFQLVKLVVIAIVFSIVSLVLWSDQPWFLVPWSFGLITLLLFQSRMTGTPTIAAVLYVAAVFLNPEQPDQKIYGALWLFPSLALLAFGTSVIAHLTIWPQNPLTVLNQQLAERFDSIILMLDRLAESGENSEFGFTSGFNERPAPGTVSRHFQLLANAELAHPEIKAKQLEWLDLIMEVDTWFNNLTGLVRLMSETNPRMRFSGKEYARLQAIAAECRNLRNDFLALGAPSVESTITIADQSFPKTLPERPATLFLHRLEDAALRLRKTLVALHGPDGSLDSFENDPGRKNAQAVLPVWLPKKYWIDNMDALRFGMKFSLGVMVCLFVIQALQWWGIGTAMLTCVIVAQSSLGANYRMSVMRIMGASLGGLLAYVFIIVLQPALDTIAGFLLVISPVCWLSAWVGSGSPRIAYIGTQIGFSFANAVLPGYGPVTDLDTARDRVLGILLGITVVGIIDYLLWPQHSERMSISRLAVTLRLLSGFLRHETVTAPNTQSSTALMKAIDSDLQKAMNLLEHAQIEPGSNQPEAVSRRIAMDLTIDTIHCIARVAQARHRYYSNEAFRSKAELLLERQNALNHSCSEALLFLANLLEAKPAIPPPPSRTMLMEVEQSAYQLTIGPAIDWNTAKSIHACVDLDKILLDYLDGLGSLVNDLAETG